MNLGPVEKRLRDECPSLKLVGSMADFESARKGLTTVPAAFVMPARDVGQPSPFGNQIVEQRVGSEFVVAIAVRNLTNDRAAVDSLEPVRDEVRDALLGWQPDAPDNEMDGCEFGAGVFFELDVNKVLWWTDSYRTANTIRSA